MNKTTYKSIIVLLTLIFVISSIACAGGKISQDDSTAAILQRISDLQNKYEICKTQWYDIYQDGVVLQADDAAKLIIDARSDLSAGNAANAQKLLDAAEVMLNTYSKASLPVYQPSTPMSDPNDLGNIHFGTIDDLKALSLYSGDNTIPRWNYWHNFVGTGSDGKQYMAYAFLNHHGTGHVTPPTVFAYSCSDNPTVINKIEFKTVPTYTPEKDKITWSVQEDGKSLTYALKQGKVFLEYKDANVLIQTTGYYKYSYWYNKNIDGGALMMPGAVNAGFEQPGAGEATFQFKDKTVTVKNAFSEQENLFCGGPHSADYRSALIKYGNEWWIALNSDQISGLICIAGRYQDGGIYYKDKYYVPKSITITPIVANDSFWLDVEFGDNNKLHFKADAWGWDPKLYEHWGDGSGDINGKKLTNGYVWLEHIPKGGVNASPPTAAQKNKQ